MQISFTFDGIKGTEGKEGTEALKTYIQKRFNSLQAHGELINNIKVILRTDSRQHVAEANLHVTGKGINAKAASEDMYESIDELIKKLEAQIKKHKEKLKNHHHD